MAHLWRLPHYNEVLLIISWLTFIFCKKKRVPSLWSLQVAFLTLGRTFNALLLPVLKNLIRGRLSSNLSLQKSSLDCCNDFRHVLKIVSQNKFDCFSDREARLCSQLRRHGNIFAHNTKFEHSFVSRVLSLTRDLLNEINKRNDVDQWLRMLLDIVHFFRSNTSSCSIQHA